jgi:hypothetical protein
MFDTLENSPHFGAILCYFHKKSFRQHFGRVLEAIGRFFHKDVWPPCVAFTTKSATFFELEIE